MSAPCPRDEATARARRLEQNLRLAIRGKDEAVRRVVVALAAGGHALIEDVPGTGKTTLAKALARSLDACFRRVQLTPDLLPADITGVTVLDPAGGGFRLRPGPVFAEVLLADEINRATPRTQAALLEALEERQVTIDGETHALSPLFFCLATLNPVEQQGTFPLPEAELDRFLLRIGLGYPSAEDEAALVLDLRGRSALDGVGPCLGAADALEVVAAARATHVDPSIARYVVAIARATRDHPDLLLGASPRASLAVVRAAQALALIEGAPQVEPEHVQAIVIEALAHRLLVRPQARIAGVRADAIVDDVVRRLPVPIGG